MKISIVTTSYNQAPFLDQTLASVIEQGYPDLDYIVVDPGSTDGSREIIERWRDRIHHLVLDPDDGPADGLNHGFARASGEIYGFLNADDLLADGALSDVARAFARFPEIDVISAHGWLIDGDGRRIRRKYSNHFSIWRYAHQGAYLLQQSTFFRADAFKSARGFNPDNRTCWDGELWLDMALAGRRFKTVRGFWSSFRVHEGSLSAAIARRSEKRGRYQRDRARLYRKATGRVPKGAGYCAKRAAAELLKWGAQPIALADRCLSILQPRARRCPL
jgi:glycosyltransferase involved in cell wall biosynthesis